MGKYEHITFNRNWALDEETVYMLGQCDCIVQAIASMPINPETHKRLMSVSLRKGARATTAIEGNTLSEEEVEKIQEGEKLPPSKEYLQIEVQNIIDALNSIGRDVLMGGMSSAVSCQMIESFNKAVGQNLGEHFQSVPGKFRQAGHNVVVGKYRAPDGADVSGLMERFCDWLRREFQYEEGGQTFSEQIIQAIVSHIYIAMIHPFGDGNGRTARLLEFYILLRAGLPNIASHILSNHYNDTRQEYYRQLDLCTKTRSLSQFIKYAVQGLRDGLTGILNIVQGQQLFIAWQNHIYETLDSKKALGKTRAVVKRRRTLALRLPLDKEVEINALLETDPILMKLYAPLKPLTLKRDLRELLRLGLVIQKGARYRGQIEIMKRHMPIRKED